MFKALVRTSFITSMLLGTGANALGGTASTGERELLVVSELQTHADQNYLWLYRFIESSSVSMAAQQLGHAYKQIWVLAGTDATKENFVNATANLTANEGLKALDVFVHLHGSPGALWFREGGVGSADLKTALSLKESSRSKLRAFYSTACYAASHSQDMLDAGFVVSSGANKVNTNAAYDYPTMMSAWRDGWAYGDAQNKGNNKFWRNFYDGIASSRGFGDTDSFKPVLGNAGVTINDAR